MYVSVYVHLVELILGVGLGFDWSERYTCGLCGHSTQVEALLEAAVEAVTEAVSEDTRCVARTSST